MHVLSSQLQARVNLSLTLPFPWQSCVLTSKEGRVHAGKMSCHDGSLAFNERVATVEKYLPDTVFNNSGKFKMLEALMAMAMANDRTRC